MNLIIFEYIEAQGELHIDIRTYTQKLARQSARSYQAIDVERQGHVTTLLSNYFLCIIKREERT